MLSYLPLVLSMSATDANAKGKLDHERSVTVSPLKLIEPRVHVEYENKLSDKTSFTLGATYGRYNNIALRLFNATSESLGGEQIRINNVGGNGAFNYYFKNFNRGWYTGGAVEFDKFTATVGETEVGGFSTLEIGPTIGWKRCTEGGFTFSFDWGVGYAAVFGVQEIDGTETPSALAFLGSMQMGYSF